MANIKVELERTGEEESAVYNKDWIKSIESTTQSTTNPSTIEYGILANTGRLEMKDLDGSIRADIESGVLPVSNIPVYVSVNGKSVQRHITNDSDYSEKENVLSLPLTNKISLYDNIPFDGMPLSEFETTAEMLFEDVCLYVGIDMSKVAISDDARTALRNITIKYPYMKASTAREALNKICQLAQLQMYEDSRGLLSVISTTNVDSAEPLDVYNVPSYYKITNLDRTIVLKNKYDAIDMRETKVIENINFDKLIQTNNVEPTGYLTNSNNQKIAEKELWEEGKTAIIGDGYTKIYVDTYYITSRFVIPKSKAENKEKVIKLLTGKNANGEPNIKYSVTYEQKQGEVYEIDYESTNIDNFALKEAETTSQETGQIPTTYEFGYYVSGPLFPLLVKMERTITNKSTNSSENLVIEEDGTNFNVELTLLVGSKFLGIKQWGDGGENGYYVVRTPLSVEVSFYGNVREISFEDVDVSSETINTAKNPVTISHNELLQDSATWNGEKLSTKIKNNVLEDYKNGVPTGKIELFCGDLVGNNENKVWANGDILDINDVIIFSDDKDMLSWRITGRTFTYNASPKIALELKQVVMWKEVWRGSKSIATPTKTGSDIFIDGYYHGYATTYFSYDGDYIKNINAPIRISGYGNYGGASPKSSIVINGLEITEEWTTIATNPDAINNYGVITARYDKENKRIEFTVDGRSKKPNLSLLSTISFTLTKIEQYC